MGSRADMRQTLAAADEACGDGPYPMSRREKFAFWFTYFWWPTKRWMPKVDLWWHYNVLRYPKPPPLHLDPVYKRLFPGLAEDSDHNGN